MPDLVVGAGLAGLYKAYNLLKDGHDVVILEKKNYVGGQLYTIKYEIENEVYFFDIGPHVPPKNHKIWNDLCERSNSINMPLPLKVSISLKPKLNLDFPPDLNTLRKIRMIDILHLIKFIPFYLYSSLFKIKEKNLQDSLINSWGLKFYQNYMYYFISNFWKSEPSNISKEYKARFSLPSYKYIIQKILESKDSTQKNDKNKNIFPYPKYGCEGVINTLKNDIITDNGIIRTNTSITDLSVIDGQIEVKYIQEKNSFTEKYDNIYWAASISDLIQILNFEHYKKLEYRALLTVNVSINRKDLLGDKIHTSYIMIPNIVFHRVYEPNKISPYMAPKNKTSACLEITLNKKINNPKDLVNKSLKQFCSLYNLKKSEITHLGNVYCEEAYPLLFLDYKKDFNRLTEELKMKTSKISLIGRTGQYFPYNIDKTLDSIL